MAHHLRLPLQEVQQKTTSTELLEWISYLEDVEWNENTRLEYYLAQIAAEIRAFRESFSSSPHTVSINDLLIPFSRSGEGEEVEQKEPIRRHAVSDPMTAGRPTIEIGPAALQDPKWKAVNSKAKAVWFQRLGLKVEDS